MKILKTALAALVAVTAISSVSAQTVVHITGSTAYRAAVYQAINDILNTGYTFGYSGTTASKASQAIYTGTTKTGNVSVIIKTSFSGSIGGISTLAANLTIGPGGTFTGGGGWLVNSTPQSTAGTPNAPANYDPAVTADLAMADCFQKSAPSMYRTPLLKDNIVGVVPFVWVATKGGTAILGSVTTSTSISPAEVSAALVKGNLVLSSLSGNSGDTEAVLGVGRDEDSGTRIQALACSKIGVQTPLQQYQPVNDGTNTTIVGANLWPAVTLNGISYPTGDSGYSSGGSLATEINLPHNASYSTWFISYLGINDAATVTNGIQLEFQGTAYSAANVEGPGATGFVRQYAFWGYEHLFERSAVSGEVKAVGTALVNDLKSTSASVSGILLGSMKVSRDGDGAPIEAGGKPGN